MFESYLFEFVQIVGLLMEVELQQLSLQVLYKGLTPDEILDDAVRERIVVQLHITCSATTKLNFAYLKVDISSVKAFAMMLNTLSSMV